MIFLIPFGFQGLALFFDELYFHRLRGLGSWERLGHPLDTLSVLICYVWIYSRPPSDFSLEVYLGFTIFSSLLVTKDEFVHSRECSPGENWLHAILFILHPVTFMTAGLLWWRGEGALVIPVQIILVLIFMIYQLLYWNLPWKKSPLK